MKVIRRFFSEKTKKKDIKLQDTRRGVSELIKLKSLYAPSLGEAVGRSAGMDESERLDNLDKSDLEIIEGSSNEAKKVGRLVGGTVGLTAGALAGIGSARKLKKLSKEVEKVEKLNNVAKKLNFKGKLMKWGAKIPWISKKSPKKHTSIGKVLNTMGKGTETASKVVEKVAKNPTKYSRIVRKSAVPVGLGVTALGAIYGTHVGGRRATDTTTRTTIRRLRERNDLREDK